jgi:tetratricopeptide (TPR) repeat protein
MIVEKTLGPEHRDMAFNLNELAELYREQGRFTEAEPLYRQSLEIHEASLALNNLAVLYFEQGRYDEAEPLFQRSLTIREKAMGSNHPEFADYLENYALLLRQAKRDKEAALVEARARSIRAKHL